MIVGVAAGGAFGRKKADQFPVRAANYAMMNVGGGLIVDPATLKSPQSAGTLFWGGVYGHSWFIDPAKKLTVIVFTDVPPGGKAGEFHDRIRDAVY